MDGRSELAEQWSLPERSRPPLLGELVERIDEAMATARASEAAVMTVGAAALDAAEQARRAADLAERASAALHGTRSGDSGGGSEDLGDFNERADRVIARLQHVERNASAGVHA